ncbi:MAG: FKBP-type peptidyl-prolyl cis-trans isomerase [Candidatus Saccharimonadales bacterium]
MARTRDRIFAGLGALLFFGSACALTVAVIWQANQGGSTPSPTAANTCTDSSTYPALPVPEAYKVATKVDSLQSTDLEVGSGAEAKAGDCLIVKYYGTLASDGTKFDENFTTTTAFAFTLGNGSVISGWDQGLIGMKAGGLRRLVIPASLAYGSQANGAIPANADLVFNVKLEKIKG